MRLRIFTAMRGALMASCAALLLSAPVLSKEASSKKEAPAKAAPVPEFDYNANEAFRLFSNTCLRNLGVADNIRQWAERTRLTPVTDMDLLALLVGQSAMGSTKKGGAWTLPSSSGRGFTLSIRAANQACAVWAERADPAAVESMFKQTVENSGKANASTGVTVTTDLDDTLPTKSGRGRMLTMTVADKEGAGYQFTLIAGDQPGTMFSGKPIQVSMQMMLLEGKKAKKPEK